jgi:NAD(P)-binding Rossmann-like domain
MGGYWISSTGCPATRFRFLVGGAGEEHLTPAEQAPIEQHDAVVVGAGVAGSLIAKHLTRAGFRVLLLEAGAATAASFEGYTNHLDTFFKAFVTRLGVPVPPADEAPQPAQTQSAACTTLLGR